MSDDKKTCFVISPIGSEGSDIRKRADQILKHVIKPATESCGFSAVRADEISEPGIITSQVIQRIIEDPLVIADLTGMNPNVFYELAIRHAIRKPLIQIIQKDEKLPFDVAGMRTISVDHKDLDSVEEARNEIVKQIKAIMKKKQEEIESPISVSLELQALRHSDKPEERSFAEFISVVTELRSDIAAIEKRLSTPEALIPPSYMKQFIDLSRMRSNKLDMLIEKFHYQIRKMAQQLEMKKQPSKDMMMELERMMDMLMMIRHEIG